MVIFKLQCIDGLIVNEKYCVQYLFLPSYVCKYYVSGCYELFDITRVYSCSNVSHSESVCNKNYDLCVKTIFIK